MWFIAEAVVQFVLLLRASLAHFFLQKMLYVLSPPDPPAGVLLLDPTGDFRHPEPLY